MKKIIRNTDVDTSRQRIHTKSRVSGTFISILKDMYQLFICLLFVATPVPFQYTTKIKAEMDLVNDLIQGPTWDYNILKSPHVKKRLT